MLWIQFVLCLIAIVIAGTRLAKYADVIADRSRLGRIWIGLALVAIITAMPEMATGISAATLVDSPDLAMGTLIGSCCFNLALFAVLDIANTKRPVLSQVSNRHLPGVRWGFLLLCIVGVGVFLAPRVSLPMLGWLSLSGLLLMAVYLYAIRRILRTERQTHVATSDAAPRYRSLTLRSAVVRFLIAAMVVVAAGIWLSFIGDGIATATGWGSTFVGTLLLAAATSTPELVICVSAVRMGFRDIAIADLLGANMLDVGMVGVVDAVYMRGSLLAGVSQINVVVIACAAVMVAITGLAIWRRNNRYLVWRVIWYGPVLVVLYLAVAYVLFTQTAA